MKLGPLLNPVKIEGSSQIKEVGYNSEEERLFVVFSNGSAYHYCPVPENKYDALVNAPSVGSYFHKHIKSDKSIIHKPL